VLLVRNAICKLECLNKLVMYLVSLPVYVKVVNLRSCSIVRDWGRGWRLGACWVWEGSGKELLWPNIILFIHK